MDFSKYLNTWHGNIKNLNFSSVKFPTLWSRTHRAVPAEHLLTWRAVAVVEMSQGCCAALWVPWGQITKFFRSFKPVLQDPTNGRYWCWENVSPSLDSDQSIWSTNKESLTKIPLI